MFYCLNIPLFYVLFTKYPSVLCFIYKIPLCVMFYCLDTPLTLSASLQRPRSVMLALVGGGAFLDFRNRNGLTSMHVAAQRGNRDALRVRLLAILSFFCSL